MQKDNCCHAIEGEWSNGPSLLEGRSHHAAGIVTDEVTNENFAVVTGCTSHKSSKSTEILQDGKWVQGKLIDTLSYRKAIHYTRLDNAQHKFTILEKKVKNRPVLGYSCKF